MVVSTDDARPVRLLFSILVMRVHALVLMGSGVSALCVLDLVFYAGAVVLITGLRIFFLISCLAIVDCSTLVTIGVDTVENCWVGCFIDLVWRDLLLVLVIVTLEIAGPHAVVVDVSVIDGLCCIALSVI